MVMELEKGIINQKKYKKLIRRKKAHPIWFKLWNVLCMIPWVCMMMFAVSFMMMDVFLLKVQGDQSLNIVWTAMFLFSCLRICRRMDLVLFKSLTWRKKIANIFCGFIFFIFFVLITYSYYTNVMWRYVDVLNLSNGMPHVGTAYIQSFLWLLPVIFFSIMLTALFLRSIRVFFLRLIRFTVTYVMTYLIFRMVVFLVTLTTSWIMLRIAKVSPGNISLSYIVRGYFRLMLDESLGEDLTYYFLVRGSVFIANLTAVSSYTNLSDLALESMNEEKKNTFSSRMRDLFGETEIRLLFLMSVSGALISFLIGMGNIFQGGKETGGNRLVAGLFLLLMGICWLVSFITSLTETKAVPFCLAWLEMYFIGEAVVDPTKITVDDGDLQGIKFMGLNFNLEATDANFWRSAVILWIVRVLLFALASGMTAYCVKYMKDIKQRNLGKKASADEVDRLEDFYEGNIFKLIRAITRDE